MLVRLRGNYHRSISPIAVPLESSSQFGYQEIKITHMGKILGLSFIIIMNSLPNYMEMISRKKRLVHCGW